MQTTTARQYNYSSILQDLKDICGDSFELIPAELRLGLLTAFSHYQLLRITWLQADKWTLMDNAIDSVPAVVWLGNQEVRERVLRCWVLDDNAIAHLIQTLAENI